MQRAVASPNVPGILFAILLTGITRHLTQGCNIAMQAVDFVKQPTGVLKPDGFILISSEHNEVIDYIVIGKVRLVINKHMYYIPVESESFRLNIGKEIQVACKGNSQEVSLQLYSYAPCKVNECHRTVDDAYCKGCVINANSQYSCSPDDCSLHSHSTPWTAACVAGGTSADTECHALKQQVPVTHLVNQTGVVDCSSHVFPLILQRHIPVVHRNPDSSKEYNLEPLKVGETILILDTQLLYDVIEGPDCPAQVTLMCSFESFPEAAIDLCEYENMPLTYQWYQYGRKPKDKLICYQYYKSDQLQAYFYMYVTFSEIDSVPITCPVFKEDSGEAMQLTCHWRFKPPFSLSAAPTTLSHYVTGICRAHMVEINGYSCDTTIPICDPWRSDLDVSIYVFKDYCHQTHEEPPKEILGFIYNDSVYLEAEIANMKFKFLATALSRIHWMRRRGKEEPVQTEETPPVKDEGGVELAEKFSSVSLGDMGLVKDKDLESIMSIETKVCKTKSMENFFKQLRDLDIGENPSLDLTPSSTVSESRAPLKREPRMSLYTKVRAHAKEDVDVMVNKTGVEAEPSTEAPQPHNTSVIWSATSTFAPQDN